MTRTGRLGILIAGAALLAVAGCASKQRADKAAVEVKGSEPAARTAAPRQIVDSYGIITYETYQAAVARDGDTVSSVAARIGLSGSELGAYNGLSPTYPLRKGDELVLPPRPGGYGERATQSAAAPQSTVPQSTVPPGGQPLPPFGGSPSSGSTIEQIPLDGSSGTAPASGAPAPAQSSWSPDLAAAAIDRAGTFDQQGNLAPPPSSTDPVPPAPQEPGTLTSPNLGQYQTPEPAASAQRQPEPKPVETLTTREAAPEPEETVPQVAVATPAPQPATPTPSRAAPGELRLIRPVQGPVVVGFQQGAGRARNEGIDFASPAGSAVVAAASGEVALVSQSLGGLGTIVLIRHPGDYLTVYGRIDKVNVVKGDLVSQGQKIGVVSFGTEPRMHFEVRQGAESYDPERFFKG